MSKTLELSEDTYQRLIDIAQQQQCTPEEVIRAFLLEDADSQYRQANLQMMAQVVLTSLPTEQPLLEEDAEPASLPGKSLSEIIIEERR
jgi:hypothetical protein